MRAKRAKALRTKDLPHPGRKRGGTMKAEAEEVDARVRRKIALRRALDNAFKPKEEK